MRQILLIIVPEQLDKFNLDENKPFFANHINLKIQSDKLVYRHISREKKGLGTKN